MKNPLAYPVYAYNRARAFGFAAEGILLNLAGRVVPGKKKTLPDPPLELLPEIAKQAQALLRQDAEWIAEGKISPRVLIPEHPAAHLQRLPVLLADSVFLGKRRVNGKTTEFSDRARELLSELPRYYRRNFHFQTDGYLSEGSAHLYEHQVEILFGGTADAMRRLLIPKIQEVFGDGSGRKILEIGAGTGRMTRFLAQCFPRAQIVATDLSAPYLQVAKRRLSSYSRVSFLQCAGEDLPFRAEEFDAVVSCFLFHELPEDIRVKVMTESLRVLKKSGYLGWIDSFQKADHPEWERLNEIFPAVFHEPFYRNYSEVPMQAILSRAVGRDVSLTPQLGFLSQAAWLPHPQS
jgi:ubiquinone/menaquinone biosynthesis C-methylase UbiE